MPKPILSPMPPAKRLPPAARRRPAPALFGSVAATFAFHAAVLLILWQIGFGGRFEPIRAFSIATETTPEDPDDAPREPITPLADEAYSPPPPPIVGEVLAAEQRAPEVPQFVPEPPVALDEDAVPEGTFGVALPAKPEPKQERPKPAPKPAAERSQKTVVVQNPKSPPPPKLIAATPIYSPKPNYPATARRRDEQGTAILLVSVNADGKVSAATLRQSSGFDSLDSAALAAVKRWKFKPAHRGGEPMSSQVAVPIAFSLN
ncbi:MAG: TonB family protein [Verrucomicrobiales bacterium]